MAVCLSFLLELNLKELSLLLSPCLSFLHLLNIPMRPIHLYPLKNILNEVVHPVANGHSQFSATFYIVVSYFLLKISFYMVAPGFQVFLLPHRPLLLSLFPAFLLPNPHCSWTSHLLQPHCLHGGPISSQGLKCHLSEVQPRPVPFSPDSSLLLSTSNFLLDMSSASQT